MPKDRRKRTLTWCGRGPRSSPGTFKVAPIMGKLKTLIRWVEVCIHGRARHRAQKSPAYYNSTRGAPKTSFIWSNARLKQGP